MGERSSPWWAPGLKGRQQIRGLSLGHFEFSITDFGWMISNPRVLVVLVIPARQSYTKYFRGSNSSQITAAETISFFVKRVPLKNLNFVLIPLIINRKWKGLLEASEKAKVVLLSVETQLFLTFAFFMWMKTNFHTSTLNSTSKYTTETHDLLRQERNMQEGSTTTSCKNLVCNV